MRATLIRSLIAAGFVLTGCHSNSPSPSGPKGPGVVGGNGDESFEFKPTPLPQPELVAALLATLSETEPKLAGAIRDVIDGQTAVRLLKTTGHCWAANDSTQAVAAFFDDAQMVVGFCHDFHVLSANRQTIATINQLNRVVLVTVGGAAPEIEASAGATFEVAFTRLATAKAAGNPSELQAARDSLRKLVSDFLPSLASGEG